MLSWFQGPSIGLVNQSVGELLRASAAKYPNRTAVTDNFTKKTLTYKELQEKSESFAEGLCSLGIGNGDKIGLWTLNCVEWTITQYAAAMAGVVLVNINPAYKPDELAWTLKEAQCKALITADHFGVQNYEKFLHAVCPEVPDATPGNLNAASFPDLKHLIMINGEAKGFFGFEEIYGRKSADYAERTANVDPNACFNIQFTSGTTGLPKGAMLSHFNQVNNARVCSIMSELKAEDVISLPLPLYHCFAMVGA